MAARADAGLPGAFRLREARGAAPHPQRQGRPAGAAGSGAARRWREPSGAADARRGDPRGPLGRSPRARAGRSGRPILRVGRAFASGDAGDVTPARRLRRRDAATRPLRGPGAGRFRRPGGGGAPVWRRPARSASRSGSTRRGHAPVVRPAAPLVHRPARAGEPALQHCGSPAHRRVARRRASGAPSARSCAATRRCVPFSPRATASRCR